MLFSSFAFGASPALAVPDAYFEVGSFGEAEPGGGQGQFNEPRRADVYAATGELLVVDRENNRVQVFEPDGDAATYLTEFGSGVLSQPFGIAIDQDDGDVYVSNSGSNQIVKFNRTEGAPPTFAADAAFTSPPQGAGAGELGSFEAALAVDQTDGDLWVADPGNLLVQHFTAAGVFVDSFDGSSSPLGLFKRLTDIEVDGNGNVVLASEREVPGEGVSPFLERFNQAGAQQFEVNMGVLGPGLLEAEGKEASAFRPGYISGMTIAVNPDNRIVVGTGYQDASVALDLFDGATHLSRTAGFPSFVWGWSGLAIDGASGRLYAPHGFVFGNGANGVRVLEAGTTPTLVLDPASQVTPTSAHLSATVNPNGNPTEWRFEYRAAGEEWFQLPIPNGDAGSGNSPVVVEEDLEGLSPNAEYDFRLVATNSAGAKTTPVQHFDTDLGPPAVEAMGAAPVTPTTARLNARVNPNGQATTYYFEYGMDGSYGSSIPASQDAGAGSGSELMLVDRTLIGLQPSTTYHYRLVAKSASGTTLGADSAFVTPGPDSGPQPRGLELVNDPDKGNQNALPVHGFPVSPDSRRVLWTTTGGTPGGVAGNLNVFAAERTPSGWRSRSLVPPVGQQAGGGGLSYELNFANESFDAFVFKATSGVLSKNDMYLVRVNADGSQDVLDKEPGGEDTRSAYAEVQASDDLSHVYFNGEVPYDPSHVPGTSNVYELGSPGNPELVSRMPGTGEAPPCGVWLGTGPAGFSSSPYNWISTAPGAPRRAYFEVNCSGVNKLYLRDLEADTTTLVSGPPISGLERPSSFIRTSADGARAIFVSGTRLVPEDHNDTNDLYRFTIGTGVECLTCAAAEAGVFVDGNFGRAIAVSDDLSRIVFLSRKLLVPGRGVAGEDNIYLWHDGETEFLAVRDGDGRFNEAESVAMTPGDGRVIVFATAAEGVTADDTGGFFEFYRYDDVDKSMECLTCPRGGPATVDAGGSLLAGQVGIVNPVRGGSTLSDDARTFAFQTEEPLDQRDVNQESDIYVWRNGQVRIVTDGVTKYPQGGFGELRLAGLTSDASDIIFTAGVNFTGWERDNVAQLYSAHIGGGFPFPTPPAPCDEDDCQGPLQTPPGPQGAGSASFRGLGNERTAQKKAKKHRKKRQGKKKRAKRRAAAKRSANGGGKATAKNRTRRHG